LRLPHIDRNGEMAELLLIVLAIVLLHCAGLWGWWSQL